MLQGDYRFPMLMTAACKEADMRVAMKAIVCSALLVISGGAFSQGMNGGAAEAKGATGTGNPSGEGSTAPPSSSGSGKSPSAAATNNAHGKMHHKSGTATPASASGANRASGGS